MAAKAKIKNAVPLPRKSGGLTLSFGLLNCQIGYAPMMVSDSGPRAKTLCSEHHHPVGRRWYCEAGDHYPDETVAGFEHGGEYVFVNRAEAQAEKDNMVQLERLVAPDAIDPLYYEKTYLIWPGDGHGQVHDLLAAALRDAGGALIGRTVISKSTRLVVIRWSELTGSLVMHLCQFDAKVRWADAKLVADAAAARPEPNAQHLEMAKTLLEQLAGEFEPAGEDDYAAALEAAIEAAANGVPIPAAEAPAESAPVIDLMAALSASVQAAQAKPAAKKPVKVAA